MLAYLFLGERLPGLFYVSFILIFLGTLVLSSKEFSQVLKPDRPFWLMLLASFLFAVQAVVLKFAYNNAGFLEVLVLLCAGRIIAGAAILMVPSIRGKFTSSVRMADWKIIGMMLAFSTIAIFFYNYAVSLGSVSIVEVLSGVYPFSVLLFATMVVRWAPDALEERVRREDIAIKVFAGALMFIGLVLLYK